MTNSIARKSMAVAAIAAGVVLFGGGMAQASDSSIAERGHHHGMSLDQDSTNICGNVIADDSIVFDGTVCDAVNIAVDED